MLSVNLAISSANMIYISLNEMISSICHVFIVNLNSERHLSTLKSRVNFRIHCENLKLTLLSQELKKIMEVKFIKYPE